MMFLDSFFLFKPLLAALGITLVAGPLGSFVVWRRMSFFGDALAHSTLMGVALSLWWHIDVILGGFCTSILITLLLVRTEEDPKFTPDLWLSILSQGLLALGIITISLTAPTQGEITAYLFGDILAVDERDLILIYCGGIGVLFCLWLIWRPLLLITLNRELAYVAGINIKRINSIFMLLMAVTLSIAIKIVGVLLITALLIIPTATARNFSKSPEGMVLSSCLYGAGASLLGIFLSFYFNLPTSPCIVVAALLSFIILFPFRRRL